MENEKFGWIKASDRPEAGTRIILAIPSLDGTYWIYEFGGYFLKGDVYHSTDKEIQVKNDGYYIFSRKYKELLRVTEVKYYSYIAKPSDIRNELIIVDQ